MRTRISVGEVKVGVAESTERLRTAEGIPALEWVHVHIVGGGWLTSSAAMVRSQKIIL